MTEISDAASRLPAPRLESLGGAAAPHDLAADLACLSRMPRAAQSAFWRVLGPSLEQPVAESVEQALESFAQEHELERAELARAIRGLRFLIREAARRNIDAATFLADLDRVTGADETVHRIAEAGYDRARAHLRTQFASRAVRLQGDALLGVDWRLDRVLASAEAEPVDVDVALFAFHLESSDGVKRTVHFQADVSRVRSLRAICDAIEAASKRKAAG